MRSFEVATGELALVFTKEELAVFHEAIGPSLISPQHGMKHIITLALAYGETERMLKDDFKGGHPAPSEPEPPIEANWS